MRFLPTRLPGVTVVEPDVSHDARGFFLETYHARTYQEGGITAAFVQDNHSQSSYGTLRGLHAQMQHPQGKLIRALEGEIFDVAVDIRRGSATFAQWTSVVLSAKNFRQLYIPPGFAHGFAVLSERAQIAYKCTDFYNPNDEICLAWNDPDIGIEWPVKTPLLSAKDLAAPFLRDIEESLPLFQPETETD